MVSPTGVLRAEETAAPINTTIGSTGIGLLQGPGGGVASYKRGTPVPSGPQQGVDTLLQEHFILNPPYIFVKGRCAGQLSFFSDGGFAARASRFPTPPGTNRGVVVPGHSISTSSALSIGGVLGVGVESSCEETPPTAVSSMKDANLWPLWGSIPAPPPPPVQIKMGSGFRV